MLPRKLASLAVGAALLLGTAAVVAQDRMPFGRPLAPAPLAGTWDVVITPYGCATGAQLPSFRSRLTFLSGGMVIESPFNPSFQAGQRSHGLGTWERTGRDSYRSVFEAFIHFTSVVPVTVPPTPPRYTRGVQRVDQGIEMDGTDRWTSTASVSFFDEAGNPLNSGCMSAVGTRQT